jgi:hypothetical protein
MPKEPVSLEEASKEPATTWLLGRAPDVAYKDLEAEKAHFGSTLPMAWVLFARSTPPGSLVGFSDTGLLPASDSGPRF